MLRSLLERPGVPLNKDYPTISDSFIKGRCGLNHWDVILKEWINCIQLYCKEFDGQDAPYIYTERSNVGTLAAASWRGNLIALEEFQYPKKHRKRKWEGRVDLYIRHKKKEEMIEAKCNWIELGSKKAAKTRIEEVLLKAKWDADDTFMGSKVKTLAIAFLPAYIEQTKDEDLETLIENTVTEIRGTFCDAAAWCFPREYRRVGTKTRYFPGIIMAILNPEYHEDLPKRPKKERIKLKRI